ncbi:hypothetical protein ASD64_20105 [Mesorhizobium sp. Root157]|uniref:Ku protein n=1 Tax=Mesorhizobium sp. Root157 TaxID=1736477 RepID=UPI0006F66732|nr:Ku protein [Mesorhizobium sp. Root157]KQZ84812.1 hypothetical protein ASD64_20105 [Mesorhizobium sp. Root157]
MTAPRAAWKGFLRMGSVTCGVKIVGAITEAEKIRFNILNQQTGNTVKVAYLDEEAEEAVDAENQIKGYEVGKGDFIQIEKDELKALKLSSEHTLDVDEFVPMDEIDTRYLEKPYYLLPADKPSTEPFVSKQDPELLEIASLLIDKKPTKFDPSKFDDRYEQALIELIDAKRKGKKQPKAAPAPQPKNVVNLAEVLRKSLQQEGGKAPAKSGEKKKAA